MKSMANISKGKKFKVLMILVGVLLVNGMIAGIAYAAEVDDTSIDCTVGVLNMSALTVGDFASTMLDGSGTQTSDATMNNFAVTDATGSGAGWHVTVQATQFDNGSGDTFPQGSLSMAEPGVAGADPPGMTSGPYDIDVAGAVTIASAIAGDGMGAYNFTPGASGLTVTIPATALVDTYTSTVTVDLISGP